MVKQTQDRLSLTNSRVQTVPSFNLQPVVGFSQQLLLTAGVASFDSEESLLTLQLQDELSKFGMTGHA